MSRISLIAAVARNGAVGRDNQLLWRLPEDMRYFREQTMGCPVVMGRKTWDSIPEKFRPLPGRHNIVVTRQTGWQAPGATVAHSFEAALAVAPDAPRTWVIGGGQLWAAALPLAQDMLITEIDRDYDGDTHFPDWPRAEFDEVSRQVHQATAPNDFKFAFVTYRRRQAAV